MEKRPPGTVKLPKRCEDYSMETVVKQRLTAPLSHGVPTRVLHGRLRIRVDSSEGQRIPTLTSARPSWRIAAGRRPAWVFMRRVRTEEKKARRSSSDPDQPLVRSCRRPTTSFAEPHRTSDFVSTRLSAGRDPRLIRGLSKNRHFSPDKHRHCLVFRTSAPVTSTMHRLQYTHLNT